MIWAVVLVCVAGIAIVVIRSRKPQEEPRPIVAVPVPTPKRTPLGPQLRAKSTTAQPPISEKAVPIASVLMTDSEPIVRVTTPRLPSSLPLDVPLDEITRPKSETDAPKYQAPEMVFDPASTPEIPLAEHPRQKPPTIPPVDSVPEPRAKRPSSTPPPMEKQGTPAKGVVMRKPPTIPPDPQRVGTPAQGVALRSKTPGAVQQIAPPDAPPVVVPESLANKLRYTTLTANISHVGIDAKREDGFARVVMWPDVVGIVARRLPATSPYEGATFIDLVSSAGATLRILPWTQLTGDAIVGDGVERARALCQLVAARCRGAKLDPATRTFIGSHGQAAQLPDEATLAAHDNRLA